MFRTGILVSTAFTFAGCASTIQSITDRPITSDHLEAAEYGSKIKSMSGDRRLIRVVKSGHQHTDDYLFNEHVICAETHADAIALRTSKSSVTGVQGGPISGANDEVGGELEKVFARTGEADLFRQAAWQLCNSYANGVLTKAEYSESLRNLVASVAKGITANETAAGD